MRVILIGLALTQAVGANAPATAHAQASEPPAEAVDPLFTPEDLWFAGGFVLTTAAMVPLDRYLAEMVRDSVAQTNQFLRWTLDAAGGIARPGAYVIGGALYGGGMLIGNERMEDLGLHGLEAVILADLINRAMKGLAGRARPPTVDDDSAWDFDLFRGIGDQNYQSFPSGHATTAFAAAAAVTAETERWWPEWKPVIGTIMFGGATLTALSRMYNNRHWASDVAMGAAIGSFAGWKIVRYTHTHPDNRLDRLLLPAGAIVIVYTTIMAGREAEPSDADLTGAGQRRSAASPRAGLLPGSLGIAPGPDGRLALVWTVPLAH